MNTRVKFIVLILSLALIFFSYSARANKFENLKPSTAVTKDFQQSKIDKDYNYYYGGSDIYPTIIFALEKNYLLEGVDDLWKKLDVKPESLAYLISNMQIRGVQCCLESPQGFEIVDNDGKKIGVWYSILAFAEAPVMIKENNRVAVYPPRDTDFLKAYDGRANR